MISFLIPAGISYVIPVGNRTMGFIEYPGIYASDFLYLRNRFLK